MPGVIPDGDVSSSFCVLGVRVDAVQIEDVIVEMETWIGRRDKSRFIAVTGMHGVTEAHEVDSSLRPRPVRANPFDPTTPIPLDRQLSTRQSPR